MFGWQNSNAVPLRFPSPGRSIKHKYQNALRRRWWWLRFLVTWLPRWAQCSHMRPQKQKRSVEESVREMRRGWRSVLRAEEGPDGSLLVAMKTEERDPGQGTQVGSRWWEPPGKRSERKLRPKFSNCTELNLSTTWVSWEVGYSPSPSEEYSPETPWF